jgi:hypothetical protein
VGKPRKPRKPRRPPDGDYGYTQASPEGPLAATYHNMYDATDCRRAAAWLLRMATWIDHWNACDACACRNCIHAEDARKERAVRARDEYDAMRAVVEAARDVVDRVPGLMGLRLHRAIVAYASTTRGGTK